MRFHVLFGMEVIGFALHEVFARRSHGVEDLSAAAGGRGRVCAPFIGCDSETFCIRRPAAMRPSRRLRRLIAPAGEFAISAKRVQGGVRGRLSRSLPIETPLLFGERRYLVCVTAKRAKAMRGQRGATVVGADGEGATAVRAGAAASPGVDKLKATVSALEGRTADVSAALVSVERFIGDSRVFERVWNVAFAGHAGVLFRGWRRVEALEVKVGFAMVLFWAWVAFNSASFQLAKSGGLDLGEGIFGASARVKPRHPLSE